MADVISAEFTGPDRGKTVIRQHHTYDGLRQLVDKMEQPIMLQTLLQYADEVDTHTENLQKARKGFGKLLAARVLTFGAGRAAACTAFEAHMIERTSQHNMLLMALDDERYTKAMALAAMGHVKGWRDLPSLLEDDAEAELKKRNAITNEKLTRPAWWHLVTARTFIKPNYN